MDARADGPRTLCVYCGSSNRIPDSHKQAAARFGTLLAEDGCRMVYGGGRVGLMGIVADAMIAGGAEVIGIIPEFLHDFEVGHTGVTRLEVVDSMHTRKRRMAELSDAFVVLPGGLGTLDELFEITTWRQLGLHQKPIVLVNQDGYWSGLLAMIDAMCATGYLRPEHLGLLRVVDNVDAVLPALARVGEPDLNVKDKWL
ncbi:MAG: TIGR00730 family Rossman fold protein [Alphaproteobacteria bacterium]